MGNLLEATMSIPPPAISQNVVLRTDRHADSSIPLKTFDFFGGGIDILACHRHNFRQSLIPFPIKP